ncbi:Ig-like domain-containing protein [Paratissierella segnis]|uniref:Ig-like domain-containing protein n=1 Tax=Paratissierella segnis TaxID=2763679 RepID=A0A926ETW6_9FIRM|nr:Ig-like domain-containing protein [Paratissierella segnis]MBC8588410.1 Ig-like domain-containing protein [Paratissierella segnis]
MINPLEYQFTNTLKNYGYDVIVNGLDQVRILLKEYEEGTSITEYKYMLFRNGLIKQGDIINIFDDNWIVLHEDISINDVYTKVIIRRLKFSINFNFMGDVQSIPSAIDEGTYRLDEGQYLTLPEGRIILHMQENDVSKQIANTQRFLIMGNSWKVVQKTNAEHGIYKIYADIDIFNENDDRENEIADRWQYETKDNFTIAINNVVDSALPLDSTLQLDVTVTNNGEIVTVPLTYTSSNTSVLTVDNSGLVTCIGVGTANIRVAVTKDVTVFDTITLSVEEVIEDNFTIEIIGEGTIQMSTSKDYVANILNNGVLIEGKSVVWTVSDSRLKLSNITGTSCTVTADVGDYSYGTYTLTATLSDDENIFVEKTIEVTTW